jgi:hypothetical protein
MDKTVNTTEGCSSGPLTAEERATMISGRQIDEASAVLTDNLLQRIQLLHTEISSYSYRNSPQGDINGPLPYVIDKIVDLFICEVPDLQGQGTGDETCGALASLLFGDIVDTSNDSTGSRAEASFRIAQVIMAAPKSSLVDVLFYACALAAHRMTRTVAEGEG